MTQDRIITKSTIRGNNGKNLNDDNLIDDNPAIYKMYKITLDSNADDMESNFYKRDENGKLRSSFKMDKPLFQYTSDEVDNENLISIHVRGSSSKQGDLDRN